MKTALQMLAYTVTSIAFFGLLLFWPAGTFDYWQAWVYIAVFVVATMVPTIYLAVKYPDAFRRRTRSGPFAETRTVQKLINVGIIVGDRATLVVDTGMGPRNGATVVREVQKLAKGPKLYLTTTHFHPEHGFMSPDVFVAIAERTGLIASLTRLVARAAIVPSVSLDELIDQSEAIVHGRVTQSWCQIQS
jgi:hypothetical protein